MSVRKRPGSGGAKVAPSDDLNKDAQDIIKDNLEVMYDIVMQIREDEEFAKSIYADCPRLQHMLEKRPDLRPIFEDQRLVAINFEQVYRDAGGVLPEDEEEEELKKKKKNYIAMIVDSPCFKVLKIFLFFKKIIGCIFGGGMALIVSLWTRFCCCFDDPSDLLEEDLEDEDPKDSANKEALYRAADHMEDPEAQKQMNDLLENDPDGLADAIEDDPELRELRDNNPLCAELMTDPETMRILTEPDNLRALAEAPGLIEADFNDPDWTPPADDLEAGNSCGSADLNVAEKSAPESNNGFQAAEYASEDGMEFEFEDDEPDIEEEGSLNLEEDDQAGEEAEDEGGMEFELGDEEKNDKQGNANSQNKQNKQNKQRRQEQQQQRQGGFFGQVGAGITDMVAAQLVGVGISELTGRDDPFAVAGLEEAEGVADSGNDVATAASQAADLAAASDALLSEDMADNLEGGIDELENTRDDTNGGQGKAASAAAGGVAVAGVASTRGTVNDREDGEGEEEIVEEKKKKRFGLVGNWASAISTAGKEYIASALLGDDLGEMLVEKIEDKNANDDDKSTKSDEETAEGDPVDFECASGSSRHSLQ